MTASDATTLRRGLRVLLELSSQEALVNGGLGVVSVASLLGHDKSQVSRTLKTLDELGFVDRDPDSLTYRLGWRLFALAARAGDRRLLEEGRPLILALVDDVGERAHLSILREAEVLTLISESPQHAVQTAGWMGRSVPVHCTSSGQALLFDHDREALSNLLSGIVWGSAGPNAPRDVDDLYARVVAARSRGWTLADEEFETGLMAVAAPVRDFSGRVIAAVNVSAPKFRFRERVEEAAARTKAAADALSSRLGGAVDEGSATGHLAHGSLGGGR